MSRVYIYTYRPKYRETKEEFDRGYIGRRLKKIQNEKHERRKKEREAVEIKKALEPLSSDGWFLDPLDRPR